MKVFGLARALNINPTQDESAVGVGLNWPQERHPDGQVVPMMFARHFEVTSREVGSLLPPRDRAWVRSQRRVPPQH